MADTVEKLQQHALQFCKHACRWMCEVDVFQKGAVEQVKETGQLKSEEKAEKITEPLEKNEKEKVHEHLDAAADALTTGPASESSEHSEPSNTEKAVVEKEALAWAEEMTDLRKQGSLTEEMLRAQLQQQMEAAVSSVPKVPQDVESCSQSSRSIHETNRSDRSSTPVRRRSASFARASSVSKHAASDAFKFGVRGAAGGLAAGGAVGGTVGLWAAPFTFGLSVPVGAAIGSSIGAATGGYTGSTVGLIKGGIRGYHVDSNATGDLAEAQPETAGPKHHSDDIHLEVNPIAA